jgi:hypothetical protein
MAHVSPLSLRIARVGNMKPRTGTAVLLFTFLEVAGYQLSFAYPRQFAK